MSLTEAIDTEQLRTLAGPILRTYLDDPDVLEIMVNDCGTAFLTSLGKGMHEVEAPTYQDLDTFLRAIASSVGAEWRASSPSLDAALNSTGWRISAGRPPVSSAPFMALRKHPKHIFPLAEMEDQGIITSREHEALAKAVHEKRRIIICGGVGSAKTTLANSLLHELRGTQDRVVIVEDAPELQADGIRNCTKMRVVEGVNTLRGLVQKCLRLNPSRICIGEVRGAEALDLLQAFQTGHSGLSTLHVDKVENTMSRLEQLVQMGSVSPQRELIGEVIDIVVHMEKYERRWRCTGILAVEGYGQGTYHTTSLT